MEYLLSHSQLQAASDIVQAELTPEKLELAIERLRAAFYKKSLGEQPAEFEDDELVREAYVLATIATSPTTKYHPSIKNKALGVAGVIFEYFAGTTADTEQEIYYLLNSALFYSRGEQEAQSATLSRRIIESGLYERIATNRDIAEGWRIVLSFVRRDFKTLLKWERDKAESFFSEQVKSHDEGPYWASLIASCIAVAKYMVWGSKLDTAELFGWPKSLADQWGSSRLSWLAMNLRDVALDMIDRSAYRQLRAVGFPDPVIEALTMDSISELWMPHRESLAVQDKLDKGILSDAVKTALINIPTSSGKSLIAELVILSELAKNQTNKAVWIVPSRALVFEVQTRLQSRYKRLGFVISSSIGGVEAESNEEQILASSRMLVLTPERFDGLLRRHSEFIPDVSVVVVDEMHKIGEGDRGWLIETLIAWLLLLAESNDRLRIIFLSAVLSNREHFEAWLGAASDGFVSRWGSWRPTRLAFFTVEKNYSNFSIKLVQKQSADIVKTAKVPSKLGYYETAAFLLGLLPKGVQNNNSALVFYYTKTDLNKFLTVLSSFIPESQDVPPHLAALSSKFESVYGPKHEFTKAIRKGIGIDHGDIPMWLRMLVEENFKAKNIPILVANQVILEGVNLPIDDLIIGNLGSGYTDFRFRIKKQNFINLIGRAGRALVETEGRCFVINNWFYNGVNNDGLSWETYINSQDVGEPIRSSLLADSEKELVKALQHLIKALDGEEEVGALNIEGHWRDELERLHSIALAIIETTKGEAYASIFKWIQKTLLWQEVGHVSQDVLRRYADVESKAFARADRQLYRLAALSGLSIRSMVEIRKIAERLIAKSSDMTEYDFSNVFTAEEFNKLVNLRECWHSRPVSYGPKSTIPKVDHFLATTSWISGESWLAVAGVICAQHQSLAENTRAGLVAAYISQMFEYRLPWILGAFALAVNEMNGNDKLKKYLSSLPSFVRYGVGSQEAVEISKLIRADRDTALKLALHFKTADVKSIDLRKWLGRRTSSELRKLMPEEHDENILTLTRRLHGLRKSTWTLRKKGRVQIDLEEMKQQEWSILAAEVNKGVQHKLLMQLEPDSNLYVIHASLGEKLLELGCIPDIHTNEISELQEWGRRMTIKLASSFKEKDVYPRIELLLEKV